MNNSKLKITFHFFTTLLAICVVFPIQVVSQETIDLSEGEINVTYVANTGFLIETKNEKVLVDALFNNGSRYYMTPSEEIRTKIINGEPPFDSVKLLMITHNDIDHINASLVGEFLEKNTSRYVVCSNLTANAIKNNQGLLKYENIKNRIIAVTPELYSSILKNVNGLDISILRLRHSGCNGNEEHIGFVITMDGIKIFHGGDSDGYVADNQEVNGVVEYSRIGINKSNIDIAILNRGMFWEKIAPGIEIIKNYIKPKFIILTHFSKGNSQKEYDTVSEVINESRKEMPNITIFENSMESKIFFLNGR